MSPLRAISDVPFYTAQYYGDHRMKGFTAGAISGPQDVVPFF